MDQANQEFAYGCLYEIQQLPINILYMDTVEIRKGWIPQALEYNHGKMKKNIVLVGVAGVGKTTLGKIAAEKLGMTFIDVDMGFEEAEQAEIETLLNRYGEDGFNHRILSYFINQIGREDQTIFAASARITQYKSFWDAVRLNGVSIHLCGKLMEIYIRQDVWVRGQKLSKEEKLEKRWELQFYDYYKWRIRHCRKADFTVQVVGNKQIDAENLCKKILQITTTDNLRKENIPDL